MTRFWRAIGDGVSRLDAFEPDLNVIPPGTQENSTTPRAMAETVRRLVLGDVLRPSSRDRLRGWMAATQSGVRRVRVLVRVGADGNFEGMPCLDSFDKIRCVLVIIEIGVERPVQVCGKIAA